MSNHGYPPIASKRTSGGIPYFEYDASENALVASRKVIITVNTLGWGKLHDGFSSGENISFTNNVSDISFSPSWYGFRDQAVFTNQGTSGYVSPSSRVPLTDLVPIEPHGPPHVSATTTYNLESQALANHSVYKIEVILAEEVAAEDWVTFLIYFGHGDGKVLAFRGQFTGDTHLPGTRYEKWFGGVDGEKGTRKIEFFAGQDITTVMQIHKGNEDAVPTDLLVRASAGDPSVHYSKFWLREFKDKDISCGVTPVEADMVIAYTSDYAADTSSGPFALTVNEDVGYESFVVFDSAGTFHQNSCFVIIGTDTYEMDKKNKQYSFWKAGGIWRWSETDRESK